MTGTPLFPALMLARRCCCWVSGSRSGDGSTRHALRLREADRLPLSRVRSSFTRAGLTSYPQAGKLDPVRLKSGIRSFKEQNFTWLEQ
jgi:hypothetical protein